MKMNFQGILILTIKKLKFNNKNLHIKLNLQENLYKKYKMIIKIWSKMHLHLKIQKKVQLKIKIQNILRKKLMMLMNKNSQSN